MFYSNNSVGFKGGWPKARRRASKHLVMVRWWRSGMFAIS
jgi:hypothetical protein